VHGMRRHLDYWPWTFSGHGEPSIGAKTTSCKWPSGSFESINNNRIKKFRKCQLTYVAESALKFDKINK